MIFLWPEFDRAAVIETFDINADHEELKYTARAMMWKVDRSFQSRSKFAKQLLGTDPYRNSTARNCNTTRKLLALLDEMSDRGSPGGRPTIRDQHHS